MKRTIISYNVNGIRSAVKKGLLDWFERENPDILCFQELKANVEDVDPALRSAAGYRTYWNAAEKKGYSGVGVMSKIEPRHVEFGCGMKDYDREGRMIRLDFEQFSLLNVYVPSGSSGDDRQAFKEKFMEDFYPYLKSLKRDFPRLIVCGDVNICHLPIDIHNPVSNKNSSGFLPHEREWLSKVMDLGYKDTFRMFHPEPHQYSWWSFRANSRENNKGWRIDYHLVSEDFAKNCVDADILQDVKHSDHAPVRVVIEVDH